MPWSVAEMSVRSVRQLEVSERIASVARAPAQSKEDKLRNQEAVLLENA